MIYAAPPVEIRPTKIILQEGETLTAMCRVGIAIDYCRWTVPGYNGLNLSPRAGPHEGIKYYGKSLENVSMKLLILSVITDSFIRKMYLLFFLIIFKKTICY